MKSTVKAASAHPLVYLPVGAPGVFLIDPSTPLKDRQELASCLLDVIGSLGNLLGSSGELDEDWRDMGWAIAYLNGMAKSLLDSMPLTGEGA